MIWCNHKRERMRIDRTTTRTGSKTLRTYLRETHDKQTDNRENIRLCQRASEGDLAALTTLVARYGYIVKAIAGKHQSRGLSLNDLKYSGNIGLIKAIHRFSAGKGVELKSYASWWIHRSIQKALSEQERITQVSTFKMDEMGMITGSFNAWERSDDQEPTLKELDSLLDAKVYELFKLNPAQARSQYNWLPKA